MMTMNHYRTHVTMVSEVGCRCGGEETVDAQGLGEAHDDQPVRGSARGCRGAGAGECSAVGS